MEMKETAKQNTLWQMNSTSEPMLNTREVNPLKKFTIPKIRRTAEKGNISVEVGNFFSNYYCISLILILCSSFILTLYKIRLIQVSNSLNIHVLMFPHKIK